MDGTNGVGRTGVHDIKCIRGDMQLIERLILNETREESCAFERLKSLRYIGHKMTRMSCMQINKYVLVAYLSSLLIVLKSGKVKVVLKKKAEERKDMEMQNVVQRRNVGGSGSGGGPASNRGRPVTVPENRRPVTAKGKEDHVVIRAIRKMKTVGLRQALKPGISKAESVFWVGVFLVCVGLSFYLACMAVEEYTGERMSFKIQDDVNINHAPYPGVTVVGTNTIKQSGIDEANKMYGESEEGIFKDSWTAGAVKKLLFAMDHFCEMVSSFAGKLRLLEPNQALDLKKDKDWLKTENIELRDDPTDQEMTNLIMPFIKDNTLDCKSILLACMWEGAETDCSKLFVPVQTDVGKGCSFNRIPEKLLRTSKGLMSLLYNRNDISKKELKEWDKLDMDRELREAVDKMKISRKFPRSQTAAGNMKGVSFLLLHDVLRKYKCPSASSRGFMVAVHHPLEEPQIMKDGVAIPPGHEVFIKVTGKVIIADPGLKALPIEQRQCVFQDEIELKVFKKYTLANCQKECLSRSIAAKCKCQQLSMSTGKNETICGPTKVECVENVTRELDLNGYRDLCVDLQCLPTCNDIKYRTTVSYLPYHKGRFFNYSRFNLSSTLEFITSIVHITFESNWIPARARKLFLFATFFLGLLGGLGTSLDFTVSTVFNIIAGLVILLNAVFRITKTLFDSNSEGGNPNAPLSHDPNDAAPSNDGDVQESPDSRNDNDSEDESSSEDSSPEEAANPSDGTESSSELRETLLKGIKKTLVKDLKKSLLKDLENMENGRITQIKESLLELNKNFTAHVKTNQTLIKDLKETIEKDENDIKELKESNKTLIQELTLANEAVVKILIDKNETLMRDFKDIMTKEMKDMLLTGIKSTNAVVEAADHLVEYMTKSTDGEESERDLEVVEVCQSYEVQIFTDDVQPINEHDIPSQTHRSRFQNASDRAVLFIRSGIISSNRNQSQNESSMPEDNSRVQSVSPETLVVFSTTPEQSRPSSSSRLSTYVEDNSDDDLVETIVLP